MSTIDKLTGAAALVPKRELRLDPQLSGKIDEKRTQLATLDQDLKRLGWSDKGKRTELEAQRTQVVKELAQLEGQLDPIHAMKLYAIRSIRD